MSDDDNDDDDDDDDDGDGDDDDDDDDESEKYYFKETTKCPSLKTQSFSQSVYKAISRGALNSQRSCCWQTSKEVTKGVDKTQETPRTFCPLRYLAFFVGAFCPVCWRCCADPGP